MMHIQKVFVPSSEVILLVQLQSNQASKQIKNIIKNQLEKQISKIDISKGQYIKSASQQNKRNQFQIMNKSRILKEANEAAKMKEKDNFVLIFDDNDIYKWKAFIFGPSDSAFSDGIFELSMNLPPNYPISAPQVIFKTRIFHPNIHWETGEIWQYLNVVKDEWSPYWTLEALCRAVQQLMSNPNAESPLNCDAGNLVRSGDMDGYLSLARVLTEEHAINKEEFQKTIDSLIKNK